VRRELQNPFEEIPGLMTGKSDFSGIVRLVAKATKEIGDSRK